MLHEMWSVQLYVEEQGLDKHLLIGCNIAQTRTVFTAHLCNQEPISGVPFWAESDIIIFLFKEASDQ